LPRFFQKNELTIRRGVPRLAAKETVLSYCNKRCSNMNHRHLAMVRAYHAQFSGRNAGEGYGKP
jgi:hypothetical protein